jgi:hypothetical protein
LWFHFSFGTFLKSKFRTLGGSGNRQDFRGVKKSLKTNEILDDFRYPEKENHRALLVARRGVAFERLLTSSSRSNLIHATA